jgi:4'-phosphopantetheinyl transferase
MPTTVWIASLERAGARSDQLACLLTREEAERRGAFLHDIDRRRFTLGRALARLAAAPALRCNPHEVAIALEASGRPRLAQRNAPSLSIAHGGDLVVVALAATDDVGVDVEPLARTPAIDTLAPLVCSAAEAQALRALDPDAQARRFLSLWTLKEACLKATGAGLSGDPRDIEFDFDADAQPLALRVPAASEGEPVRHWTFTLRPDCAGHVLAVAVRGAAPAATTPVFTDAGALLAQRLTPE